MPLYRKTRSKRGGRKTRRNKKNRRGGKCRCMSRCRCNKRLRNKSHKKRRTRRQRGGSPCTFVSYPWNGGNADSWPGVVGGGGGVTQSNYYAPSKTGVPTGGNKIPQSSGEWTPGPNGGARGNTQSGGRRRRRQQRRKHTRRRIRGGSIVPNFIRDLGDKYVIYPLKQIGSGITGTKSPVNPDVDSQPINKDVEVIAGQVANVRKDYNDAAVNVSGIQ